MSIAAKAKHVIYSCSDHYLARLAAAPGQFMGLRPNSCFSISKWNMLSL